MTPPVRRRQVVVCHKPDDPHDAAMEAARAVMVATRAAGCTCRPDVNFVGERVTVSHDEWCPLLRSGDVN